MFMADIGTIISGIITGLFFLLFGLMLYQSLRKARKAYVLTISLFVGGIGGILSVLQNVVSVGAQYYLYYSLIIWSIVYFLIYIFFEELDQARPQRVRLVIATVLFFTAIIFNQLVLYFPSEIGSTIPPPAKELFEAFSSSLINLSDLSYNALGVFIFFVGAYVHLRSYKSNRESIVLSQAISLIIIAAGFLVGYIGGDLVKADGFLEYGDMVKIVGMLIFIIIYIIRIDFIYRLPVNVYFIMAFNYIGLNVLNIRTKNPTKGRINEETAIVNETLLSSLITAISNLLSESLGSKKPLQRIVSEDRTIVLDSGPLATCAVLCERPTFFLVRSLRNLRKAIEKTYKEELSKPVVLKSNFKEAYSLIEENFPFLILEKEEINEK